MKVPFLSSYPINVVYSALSLPTFFLLKGFCFNASINENEKILMVKRYWENLPNMQNEAPIIEILADGEIEVLEIVKEIHANIETEC